MTGHVSVEEEDRASLEPGHGEQLGIVFSERRSQLTFCGQSPSYMSDWYTVTLT